MGIKQTWVTKLVFTLLAFVAALSASATIGPNVYANYNPIGGKCQDGSSPTENLVRDRPTQCAESTRATTTPPPTTNTNTNTAGGTDQAGSAQSGATDDDSSSDVTCAVEKIGWILCPIMEGAAKISDKAFDVLADNFLRTDPELVQDNSGTRVAWGIARDLANIMFIIAFLVIIFAQVTGRGLSNYGIKKMLPRLIIAAIAVNVSYYICQLAVDATNILGYEIQNALAQIANSVGPSVFGSVQPASTETGNIGVLANPGILGAIVAGALAAGVVVWFMLPTIAALIPLILITVSTIIIILLLRKAFIVLLIVLAPIAFVAYLLPNTEKFFSKWMSMFTKLLLVFPIVGLLFGAGQLASTIILVAGSDQGQDIAASSCNPDNVEERQKFNTDKNRNDNSICGEGAVVVTGPKASTASGDPCGNFGNNGCRADEPATASWTLGLVATGIAIAPLLAVWAVLKGALSAAGAIGGKISGAVEKGVRGATNGGVGGGKKAWERSAFGRGQALRKQAKQDYKNERFLKGLGDPDEEGISDWEKRRRQYTRRAAGGLAGALPEDLQTGSMKAQNTRLERAAASADAIEQKRIQEETQAEGVKAANQGDDALIATIESGNVNDPAVAAAINELAKRQNFDGIEKAIDRFARSGETSLASRTLASSLTQHSTGLVTSGQIGAMSRGVLEDSYADTVNKNIAAGILSPDKMAEAGPSALDEASRRAVSDEAKQSLINSANTVASDPILSKKIGRNATQISNLRSGKDAKSGDSWI